MIDGGLRKLFRKHLPRFDWTTIESGLTGQGIPDSNFCFDGVEGWIEFKKTTAWAVEMRKEQVAWLERRNRARGRTFIAVRRYRRKGPRTVACDELWLFPGTAARALFKNGLMDNQNPPLGVLNGGPAKWDWHFVSKALLFAR